MTPEAAPESVSAGSRHPRTAAGLDAHEAWHRATRTLCADEDEFGGECRWRKRILAIEAEAAQPATPVGALDIEAVGDLIFRAYMHGWADAGMAPDPNAVVHQLRNSARLAAASEPAGGGEG